MRFPRRGVAGLALLALMAVAYPVGAQEMRGRITGIVTDGSGAVLPGVSITASGPALIQPQVVTSGAQGDYRFVALPAGLYALTFELSGFQTIKQADIRVVINTTLTVNQAMKVATFEETVTVTGESPLVDTSTTKVGTTFSRELLDEIPNSRNIWSAMTESPGMNVLAYDVGGSHAGTQEAYTTYGMNGQNTTKFEGINHTEGTGSNAGNFDYGAMEEFQIGGAGNMADQDVPGAALNVTVKSGGDHFRGQFLGTYEGHGLISDNVPDELKTAGGKTSDGYWTASALTRGNPISTMSELDPNIGGPIKRGKAWFFFAYQRVNQYKYVLNFDQLAQTVLNQPTVKVTYQLPRNNQLIGFWNRRTKLQPLRDLGPTTPVSAARYQPGMNRAMKIEWTSVLSQRAFLDVLVGQWFNRFPLRPTSEYGLYTGTLQPGRLDVNTNQYFDGGANTAYQLNDRQKPQVSTSLSYFKDGLGGSHDFKVGYDWRLDRQLLNNDQPFDIFYRDNGTTPSEVDIYNTPIHGINETRVHSVYAQDSWRLGKKLTMNLGIRMDHYTDGWPQEQGQPNGIAAVASDPRLVSFFAAKTIPATQVDNVTTFGPRAGFAYDLRGNGRSVVKVYYGRFYFNSTDILANAQNPVGRATMRFRFNDLNGNRLLDQPAELGTYLSTSGGGGSTKIDPNIQRPYGQEASFHAEQQLSSTLSARASYVYKNVRNNWDSVDLGRVNAYTNTVTVADPGPDGKVGTSDDSSLQVKDLTSLVPQNIVFTNPTNPADTGDFKTAEVALNRRFDGKWMAMTSFAVTSLNQFYGSTSSTSALSPAGLQTGWDWHPNQRRFGKEETTMWSYRLTGRYVVPYGHIGLSGTYRLQSGMNWGRTLSVRLPIAGTETIRVEAANAQRAPNVGIADLRIDTSVKLGRLGRLVPMCDVFNLTNNSVVTNFRITTGATYKQIIALLDPRIIRLGIRWEF